MHCQIVRFLRLLLGERLGEFYDEEGEADQLCDLTPILSPSRATSIYI